MGGYKRLLAQLHWSLKVSVNYRQNLKNELENILAQRCLSEEGQHLTDVSMNVVSSSVQCVETEAVGSTLCLQVSVEGVPVDALVDTGSQSTIISRSMLHSIARKQKEGGLPPPTLELPTA